jgi:hypothetical protein
MSRPAPPLKAKGAGGLAATNPKISDLGECSPLVCATQATRKPGEQPQIQANIPPHSVEAAITRLAEWEEELR